MNVKPEILVTGAFVIFTILLFGNGYLGFDTSIVIYGIMILIPLILLIYVIRMLFKIPKQNLIDGFKQEHIIIKILLVITVISLAYDIIITNSVGFSSIPLLILSIAWFCEWFFKKE